MLETPKKTPKDTTEFEREQLRFFLENDDVAVVLAQFNPSLAWLPLLAELKLIDAKTYLGHWIEMNFAEVEAIREVAANIRFFETNPDTAGILAFRLNRTEGLSTLLRTCWLLIIRHLQTVKRGLLQNEWFEIESRIKRGEHSHELLERLADVLRPKIRVGKYFSLRPEDVEYVPERPTDLISIKFEVDDNLTEEAVLSAWPKDLPTDIYETLLGLLASELSSALKEATEAGVENDLGYSLSDADVPSVALSPQNAYRKGFLPIVRVIAELWIQLAQIDTPRALHFVTLWKDSQFRLIRRLAVFAATDASVPAYMAVQVLITLPASELFLTNSSVEVYRLIDARWSDFPPQAQRDIEKHIAKGPSPSWFLEKQEEMVDYCRFELLGHLERNGVLISVDAQAKLNDIRNRWPDWELRPKERAGSHFWHEDPTYVVDNGTKLREVSDDELISEAKKAADKSSFLGWDSWQGFCQADPARALRGLESQASVGEWPISAWRPFLWVAPRIQDGDASTRIAQLMREFPQDSFNEIVVEASWWLKETAATLNENLMWSLWDRIAEVSLQKQEIKEVQNGR